jgi:hypothetical protein
METLLCKVGCVGTGMTNTHICWMMKVTKQDCIVVTAVHEVSWFESQLGYWLIGLPFLPSQISGYHHEICQSRHVPNPYIPFIITISSHFMLYNPCIRKSSLARLREGQSMSNMMLALLVAIMILEGSAIRWDKFACVSSRFRFIIFCNLHIHFYFDTFVASQWRVRTMRRQWSCWNKHRARWSW